MQNSFGAFNNYMDRILPFFDLGSQSFKRYSKKHSKKIGCRDTENQNTVKFIYSEKATKFCEILTLLLTTVHTVKIKVKISQNFVSFVIE